MKIFYSVFTCYLLIFTSLAHLMAQPWPTISEKTEGMEKHEGNFPFYWDAQEGKIWLEIDQLDTEFLYYASLAAGMGSNDIGLDRGRLDRPRIVEFRRSGPKILLIEKNLDYRANTDNTAEKRSIAEAFAESVLWGFTIAAGEENKVLVDASDFYFSDIFGVGEFITNTDQGSFSVDRSRSAFYLPRTKNFPQNTEVEVTLTFTGGNAGNYLRSVTPDPRAVTLRLHHSFVQLPDDNYQARKFDPRSGYISLQYMDYATPVDQPITQRYILRHRLEKKNPEAGVSEAVAPIVYYLDPGTPEPIRSALLEGARWWNQAFEAIGYKDAFQVKMLPEDADPMDIRYNLIQWVHRSTRGWSYGTSIYDPRTGEILKGKVTLGSLRVRQDFLIASGLVASYEEGAPVSDVMLQMSLQRLRQLSAHEVGHTLGLVHNYASSYNGRASVMDYPHPKVEISPERTLVLSNAYTNEIGAWDKVAIAYGYQDFPDNVNEEEALENIISDYISKGLLFISDRDARPVSGAHPVAHLWDNGKDAVDELNHVMEVREIALENFSEKKLPFGQPMATLEEVLVPIYMFHRYQTEAVAKLLGGMYYTYAVRGDGQTILENIPAEEQRQALEALLTTLAPEALAIPEHVLALIPPYPLGYGENTREVFKSRTGITFDPVAAAEAAANFTLDLMLNSERAARMSDLHARDPRLPGFSEVADRLVEATMNSPEKEGLPGEIQRLKAQLLIDHLLALADNPDAADRVRAMATFKLNEIKEMLLEKQQSITEDEAQQAHLTFALEKIRRFENGTIPIRDEEPLSPPDGSPIGTDAWEGYSINGCHHN